MKRKSHRIRTVTKLNAEAWPHESFVGFDLPHAGEYVSAFKKAFPPELIAEHVARLPPDARARLQRQFKLPTITTPPIP